MRHMTSFDSLRYTGSLYFLSGELDLANADELEAMFDEGLLDQGPVTIDMSAVTFIDSTAVRALLRAMQRAPKGCVILHGVRRSVYRTLMLLDVEHIRGVHVNACERDPYPTGRALLGPEGTQELVRRLAEMSAQYRQIRVSTDESQMRHVDLMQRVRDDRRRGRAARDRIRASHLEPVLAPAA